MDACLAACKKRFLEDYVCLLRLHPNVAAQAEGLDYSEKVISATDYPDMQELMAAADILITDYSGSMFEFMITKKPVFLLAKDLQDYLAGERELYFSFEELPFSLAQSEQELCRNILAYEEKRYKDACERFMRRIDMTEDGQGAKVLADIILEQVKLC